MDSHTELYIVLQTNGYHVNYKCNKNLLGAFGADTTNTDGVCPRRTSENIFVVRSKIEKSATFFWNHTHGCRRNIKQSSSWIAYPCEFSNNLYLRLIWINNEIGPRALSQSFFLEYLYLARVSQNDYGDHWPLRPSAGRQPLKEHCGVTRRYPHAVLLRREASDFVKSDFESFVKMHGTRTSDPLTIGRGSEPVGYHWWLLCSV